MQQKHTHKCLRAHSQYATHTQCSQISIFVTRCGNDKRKNKHNSLSITFSWLSVEEGNTHFKLFLRLLVAYHFHALNHKTSISSSITLKEQSPRYMHVYRVQIILLYGPVSLQLDDDDDYDHHHHIIQGIYNYINMCVCVHACVRVCVHACMHVCVYVHEYMHVCVTVCIMYTCMYACVCLVYVYHPCKEFIILVRNSSCLTFKQQATAKAAFSVLRPYI